MARQDDALHLGKPRGSVRASRTRKATVGLLAVALGVIVLMMLAILGATRNDLLGTHAWSLAQWTRQAVPLRVPLRLSETGDVWLLRGDIAVHRPKLKDDVVAPPGGADQPLPFAIDSVQRVVLSNARVWVNAGHAPAGGMVSLYQIPFAQLVEPLQRAAFSTLSIKNAVVTTQRPAGGQEAIEVDDAEVNAAPGKGITSSRGTFHLRGEKVAYEATFSPMAEHENRQVIPAHITINGTHLQGTFDGRLSVAQGVRLEGRMELASPDLRQMSRWLGYELPEGGGLGRLSIKGDVVWRDAALAFENALLTIDDNSASGSFTLNIGGPRPAVDGTLAFKTLDLSPYLKDRPAADTTAAATAKLLRASLALTAPASDIRLPFLDHVDADLRVSAAKVTGLGVDTGKGAASFSLKAGALVADVAELELAGGMASGQLRLDQSAPAARLAVRGSMRNVALDAVVGRGLSQSHSPLARSPLEGTATLKLDVAGQGRTLAELLAAASGEVHLTMPEGGRTALSLAALMSEARARRSFDLTSLDRGETAFEQLEAKLAISHGRIVTESVRVTASGATITTDGTVNLGTRSVYLRLLTDNGQGLAKTARLGRSQSVVVLGPWSGPTVKLDDPGLAPLSATTAAAPAALVPMPEPMPVHGDVDGSGR